VDDAFSGVLSLSRDVEARDGQGCYCSFNFALIFLDHSNKPSHQVAGS
jgi:hypothetical protein